MTCNFDEELEKALVRKNIDTHCPHCNHHLTGSISRNLKESPSPGDLTVCVKCNNASMFDKNLQLEKVDLLQLPIETVQEIDLFQNLINKSKIEMNLK